MENSGNKKTRNYKEYVYANQTAGKTRNSSMAEYNRHHGDGSHAVNIPAVFHFNAPQQSALK